MDTPSINSHAAQSKIYYTDPNNPNTIKSYKNCLQNTQHMVLRNRPTISVGTERLACLNSPPPWRAAGDPLLARGRSRVQSPAPTGALRALFFSTLPSFLRQIVFFAPSPPTLQKC